MADEDNDVLGKPQVKRADRDKIARIQASRMSKTYDQLEITVAVAQTDLDLGDLAALIANPQVTVDRGELFKNHKRAHNAIILVDEICRFRMNDVANPEITIGDVNSVHDTEDKIELESLFITTTQNPTKIAVTLY